MSAPRGISCDVSNDEHRHYEFARRYPYPIYTGRRITPDAGIFIVCAAIVLSGCVAFALGWL
jgi:hypothetical protein